MGFLLPFLLCLLCLTFGDGAVRRVFIVSLHPHLGFLQRDTLWRAHGHHWLRHVFRAPASYLLLANIRQIQRLRRDSRVTGVVPLHPHSKSTLLFSSRETFFTSRDRNNSTRKLSSALEHDLNVLCSIPQPRTRSVVGGISEDIRQELSESATNATEHWNDLAGHELDVTSLCFYNAGDCWVSWLGRSRELQVLLGEDAALLNVQATGGGKRVLVLQVPGGTSLCSVAQRLSQLHYVVSIERRPLYAVLNLFASSTAQSGSSDAVSVMNTPVWRRGLLGQGEVVGVGDTGVDLESCYFQESRAVENGIVRQGSQFPFPCSLDRSKVVCYYVAAAATFGDDSSRAGGGHGTHVAGSIAGLHTGALAAYVRGGLNAMLAHFGNQSAEMNGVAPLARIAVNDIGGGQGALAAPADVATSSFVAAPYVTAGVRIHSNSWGCGSSLRNPRACNMYDPLARSMDEFMWLNKDALLVVAAGNSGDSGAVDRVKSRNGETREYKDGLFTVGAPATFKNGVSVGATQRGDSNELCASLDGRPVPCSFDNLFFASARGPTLDGRVKPDVVFPGEQIFSARSWPASGRRPRKSCINDIPSGIHVYSGTVGFFIPFHFPKSNC